MGLKLGIIGLPNVGKSTLFNAITKRNALAENYPFCTIEPNCGIAEVPDSRLDKLALVAKSQKIIPSYVEFVDIAGLVKGASKGEGLGNQFLSHIRQVDAIIHVVRCFDDENIVHVDHKIDPIDDIETIETELMLSDIESVEKRIEKRFKSGDKEALALYDLLKIAKEKLGSGMLHHMHDQLKSLHLITTKPILYVYNTDENDVITGNKYTELAAKKIANQKGIIISAKIESEIAAIESPEERLELLSAVGLKETGLNQIVRAGYGLLNLKSYFTIGPKEARSWTFVDGTNAKSAAGIIHSDFEKGFIRAEVISYDDYIKYNGEIGAKETGKMRLEGKEYIVKDGDVVHFRFNKSM